MKTQNIWRLAAFGVFGLMTATAHAATPAPVCPALARLPDQNSKGIFEGKENWFFRPQDLRSNYAKVDTDYIYELSEILKAAGSKLYILPIPSRAFFYSEYLPDGATTTNKVEDVHSEYSKMINQLNEKGVSAVNVWEILAAAKDKGELFFKSDHHWTTLGSSTVAEHLAGDIKADANFPNSNTKFEISFGKNKSLNGAMYNLLKKYCPKKNRQRCL